MEFRKKEAPVWPATLLFGVALLACVSVFSYQLGARHRATAAAPSNAPAQPRDDVHESIEARAEMPSPAETAHVRSVLQPVQESAPFVNQAPTPVNPSATVTERNATVEDIRASGPDRLHLASQADRLRDVWVDLAKKSGIDVRFGRWECHAAGCFVHAVHATGSTVDELTSQISQSDEFGAWNGSKMRSGPIEKDGGQVEVTWILYAPQDPPTAESSSRTAAAERRSGTDVQ